MQAPLRKKSEIKLFILYLMRKLGYPLDYTTLNEITCVGGLINGFDFAECFSELVQAEAVIEPDEPDENGIRGFVLTQKGENIIDELYDLLIPSVRESALKSAMRLLSFRKSGYLTRQEVEVGEDGGKHLVCEVQDNTGVRLSLKLAVDSSEVLERMLVNFDRNPEHFYKLIYSALSGDAEYFDPPNSGDR